MSFRRTVGWLCAVLAGAAAGSVVAGAPAAAADYGVELRAMPSSYRAGGSPGSLTIAVTSKRKAACVLVRRALAIRLDGLSADRVRVERAAGGGWRPMPVQAMADGVRVADPSPDPAPLCRGRTATARYRITFLAGAPAGQATFVAQAFSGRGVVLGRDTATRRVIAQRGATPSPTPSPSAEPTPTASAEPGAEATDEQTVGIGAAPRGSGGGSGFGLGAVVIGIGLLMVGIGAALLVLLLRRNGRGPDDDGGDRTLLLPTVRG